MLHLEHGLYGAETWTLRSADQKYLEGFEMWCWRRMEKIIWTDNMRKEEVLLIVKESRFSEMCEAPDIVPFVVYVKHSQGTDLRWLELTGQCLIMK